MSENELLLAISDMLDRKLDAKIGPVAERIKRIELSIENEIKPQINLLAENYVPAANRFEETSDQIGTLKDDVELLKKVVAEHSEKLQKIG